MRTLIRTSLVADARRPGFRPVFGVLEWTRVVVYVSAAIFSIAVESIPWRVAVVVCVDLLAAGLAAYRISSGRRGPRLGVALSDIAIAVIVQGVGGYGLPQLLVTAVFVTGIFLYLFERSARIKLLAAGLGALGIGWAVSGLGTTTEASTRPFAIIAGFIALTFGAVATTIVVSKTRELQGALSKSELRLQTSIESVSSGLALLDADLEVVTANPAIRRMLGVNSLRGRQFLDVIETPEEVRLALKRLRHGDEDSVTTSVELGSGDDARNIALTFTAIRKLSGDVSDVVVGAHDVTEERRTQEVLEDMIRSKDEFIASISHEVRTPLTAVVGFAAELRRSHRELDDETLEEMLGLVDAGSREVAAIVEDLLVAARADIGSLTILQEEFAARAEVMTVLEGMIQTGRSISVDGDANVTGDTQRFRQVVRNLLTNAERYGGNTVEVVIEQPEDRWSQISVIDDGPGIGDRTDDIFDAYVRQQGEKSQPGSVGLGLTVSRDLARMMGGELWHERRDDKTHFIIRLPAA